MTDSRTSKQGSVIDGLEQLLQRESTAQVNIRPDGSVQTLPSAEQSIPKRELSELWQWLIDLANESSPYDSQMLMKAASIVGDRLPDEPSAAPVEAFQALQKRSRAWAQSKIDEQTNFTEAHRLALVIGFQAGWTGRPAEPPSVAAEILRKRLEQNEDLLLRAGKLLRQYAEFGGDDHSVGVCNCSDMRLVEEIEIRLGRIGCTRDAETKADAL